MGDCQRLGSGAHAVGEGRTIQIAEALLRIAGSNGLHAVTMRSVAAEAGFSVSVVQYYFESKEKLLLFALEYLARRVGERVEARIRASGSPPTPRGVIEAVLAQALPTDAEGRTFHLVYTSYAVLSVTDPALAAQPFMAAPDEMRTFLTDQLRAAQRAGDASPELDAHAEATGLLAMSAGLGTSVLLGQVTAGDALAILRYHLGRIVPEPEGART